jgi:hypothetical protein
MEFRKPTEEKPKSFRQAVKEASKKANLGWRSRFKLRLVLAIPGYRRQLEEQLLTKAVSLNAVPIVTTMDGALPTDVDWDGVIDFIIEWLPTVLKIVLLLGML